MSASRWIELVGVDQTTEAVCTLAEFLAANAEAFDDGQLGELRAMTPEDGWYAFGGGAAPESWVRIVSTKRAQLLNEIDELSVLAGAGGIEVQVDDGSDPDSGAFPFSVWSTAPDGADSDIIGAGETLDACLAEALATVRSWTEVAS